MKLVIFLFALITLHSVQAEAKQPDAAEILALLRPGHPRVLARAEDFEFLKKQVAAGGRCAEVFRSIVQSADAILKTPPSEYVIPDGKRLLDTSRRVLDRTVTLGMVYRLTGDDRYATRLWTELEAAAHFKDWNPSHFLDTAEMTAGFAIGYDWLYDRWSPEQRALLVEAIAKMGLTPSLDLYRNQRGWTVGTSNWNQVCNGGMALGALAIANVRPELAGEILQNAIASVPKAMRRFAPDGAWDEGPGYWDYATKYNVEMLAALDSALGTDFGVSTIEGFDKAVDFSIYVHGPLARAFNYADADEPPSAGPQIFWLATRFNRPDFAAWRLERAANAKNPLDLLWGARWLDRILPPIVRPTAKYFRNAEVVTMRSAWNDPDATFVGFKAGDNKASHGHLDLGSFVLDAAGQRWAIDLGKDDYNLPDYFGSKRWTYYRMRAEGHNTLVINPDGNPDQNPKAETKITRFSDTSGAAFAIADLTPAYAQNVTSLQRGIALRGHNVIVQDEIRTPRPAEVWWFLHSRANVTCDGATATFEQGGQKLIARILSPVGAVFEVLPAEPFATSPHPPRQQEKGPKGPKPQKLTIHLVAASNVRITVLLTSESTKENNSVEPLADWK